MITVLNYREGFACNSSSMHSIITMTDDELLELKNKKLFKSILNKGKLNTNFFGQETRILTTKRRKLEYFRCQILQNLLRYSNQSDYNVQYILIGLMNIINEKLDLDLNISMIYDNDFASFIDHQSVLTLPTVRYCDEYTSSMFTSFDFDFLKEFKEFILRKNTIILVTDDGSDIYEELDINYDKYKNVFNFLATECSTPIYTKSYDNGVWTLFNSLNGNKIRFSFNDYKNNILDFKGDFPELVDLKITNKCENNCEFCYQDSHENGKESDKYNIYNILEVLARNNVFEIAIGGGDPLSDKYVDNIIDKIIELKMSANMTIHYNSILPMNIFKKLSSIAISCQNTAQLELFLLNNPHIGNADKYKINIQHILGLCDKNEFMNLIDLCQTVLHGSSLILLGYKENGRGAEYKENIYDIPDWIDIIKNKYHYKIGIDTLLANTYKDQLIDSGILTYRFQIKEGLTSAYIDGVDNYISKSSYGDNEKYSFDDIINDKDYKSLVSNLTNFIKDSFSKF